LSSGSPDHHRGRTYAIGIDRQTRLIGSKQGNSHLADVDRIDASAD